MKHGFLVAKLTVAAALIASLSVSPVSADEIGGVEGYTGEFQPVTTRLDVPKSKRMPVKKSSMKAAPKKMYKKRATAPRPSSGWTKSSIAYPTGKVSTSSLLIEKMCPATVRLGKPYECTIKVTNLTDLSLSDVQVHEALPGGFQLAGAEPNFTNRSGNKATWNLGTMEPNQTTIIKIKGQANSKSDLLCCTSADYSNPALCLNTDVVQPALALECSAPAQVTACERIPLEYVVKNTGDSTLTDVTVKGALPNGVVSSSGGSTVDLRVGTLAPGEAKRVVAYGQAKDVGSYTFKGDAMSSDVAATCGAKTTRVVKPGLNVTTSIDRSQVYIGRPLTCTVNVKNTSNTDATGTSLMAKVSSASVQSASDGGRVSGNSAAWNIGTLKAGESKSYSVKAATSAAGQAVCEATANASCASAVSSQAKASVTGIPALLLEVVDVSDPVEVGASETYIITVTNQGTATARNIKVKTVLEGMKYVSDAGPTRGSVSGNTITFAPLATLAPKQRAEWSIKTIGQKAGDLRTRVSLESDDLERSVDETESTHVY